jgi:hypothetical protein
LSFYNTLRNEDDISKVKSALGLLNSFVQNSKDRNAHFQMIIFEHISPDLWTGLDNVHLVEEFRNGNALIPKEML